MMAETKVVKKRSFDAAFKLRVVEYAEKSNSNRGAATKYVIVHAPGLLSTSNKNIHFEIILDVGIGEKRKETRFLI